jgi:hypothetical protein
LFIIPIYRREMVVAVRRERVHSQRVWYTGVMLAIVLGTFAAWYYWEAGRVSGRLMARIAEQAFLWVIGCHGARLIGPVVSRGAIALAGEKDRRTLDFLLTTRLSAAEIVLEKCAASLVAGLTTMAAGLPIMLLLHILGGIDVRLIVLAYAGLATTAFLVASLTIAASTIAPDARRAAGYSVLTILAWLVVPFVLPIVLPRFGLHLPPWAATANAWLLASSPFGLAFKLVMGVGAFQGLFDAVAWMGGLQVGGGVLLLVGSIAALRPAYRWQMSGEVRALRLSRRRPVWRFRARPAVGDDPILWREMYTTRSTGLMKAILWLLNAGCLAALGSATYFFAAPAVREVWEHGYATASTGAHRPEFNLFIRIFVPPTNADQVADLARVDFNVFLRYATTAIAFVLALGVAATPAEVFGRERAKTTWTSLLATPMSGRAILRATFRAALWRCREVIAIVLGLWTIGLLAGAIHPLGYVAAILELAASTWFFMTFLTSRTLAALPTKDAAAVASQGLGLLMILLLSGALPSLLPARSSSVLLGAGSLPLMLWLSLLSYRDVQALLHSSYPQLQWIGIHTGEGADRVLAAWLIGVLVASLGGWWIWRSTVAQFDRWVGRPWRPGAAPESGAARRSLVPVCGQPIAAKTRRLSGTGELPRPC